MWLDGIHTSCYSKDFSGQSTIFALLWTDMNIERGVAIHMHLRYSPNDSNSKYIGFVGFVGFTNSVSVISKVQFLASLALHNYLGRTQLMFLTESRHIYILNLRFVAPRAGLAKVPF